MTILRFAAHIRHSGAICRVEARILPYDDALFAGHDTAHDDASPRHATTGAFYEAALEDDELDVPRRLMI